MKLDSLLFKIFLSFNIINHLFHLYYIEGNDINNIYFIYIKYKRSLYLNTNYETYRIFYYVATCGSISKAAEQLLISQPAVSFQIKSLEEQLGITLFVRTKKGFILTEEGEIFFSHIKRGIECFTNGEHALTNFQDLDYGSIRIGASTTVSKYVLMPYLEKFHEKYPNIDIQIINTLTETLLTDLRNGNLDLLLLNLPMEEAKDLKIQKVMDVHDIFVGNKKYYELTKGKIKLEELKNYPLLFQKSPSNTRNFLNQYLKKNHVSLVPKMEIVSYNLIMDFIRIGFGIGYATEEFIQEGLNKKELYKTQVIPEVPKRFIGIVTRSKDIPNYSAKKLMDMMAKKGIM